jgi:hypothetical protein
LVQLGQYEARDQIATDYEKDINADKAAAKELKSRMKQNYRNHCHGPQTVNFPPILHQFDPICLFLGYSLGSKGCQASPSQSRSALGKA